MGGKYLVVTGRENLGSNCLCSDLQSVPFSVPLDPLPSEVPDASNIPAFPGFCGKNWLPSGFPALLRFQLPWIYWVSVILFSSFQIVPLVCPPLLCHFHTPSLSLERCFVRAWREAGTLNSPAFNRKSVLILLLLTFLLSPRTCPRVSFPLPPGFTSNQEFLLPRSTQSTPLLLYF